MKPMKVLLGTAARWGSVLSALLVLGGVGPVWAQNTFPSSGNVGIGTNTPDARLHVYGSQNSAVQIHVSNIDRSARTSSDIFLNVQNDGDTGAGLILRCFSSGHLTLPYACVFETTGTGRELMAFATRGSERMRISAAGSIGIGTTTPVGVLEAKATTPDGADTSQILLAAGGAFHAEGRGAFLNLYGNDNAAGAGSVRLAAGTNGNMVFQVGPGTDLMTLTGGGRVGIGTTSPGARLHVAGDATVDGNIAAKYQDVAEWVPAGASLSPGTVVVIDPLEGNRVVPGSRPYDTGVAGVVSERPGLLLGEGGENKVKVAHSGRVKVKVDAQYGPVAVGDLLVASPTPGHAMRSTPVAVGGTSIHRPGTLLGKALEQLQEGHGEILVLLTLQ